MKASQDDVQRVLHIAEPFFDDLKARYVVQMVATLPHETEKREKFYAMIAGLNSLRRALKEYATTMPVVSADTWNGLPMEDENG